jgi:hypothetical protein
LSHTPEQFTAWNEFISEIRSRSSEISLVPDTDPPKLQIQVTDPATNRQVMLNFEKPPEMIIHLDDQGVSASGGTSAFGIEMAKLADGKFTLMRRNKQLAPKELGTALVHWLQHGTL